ncbi:MAG TPA: hypothetical protein VLA41_05170 [Burkholderiales bacterium]|nr:hypothetical protein [Burkholderiales bacterium]
MSASGESGPDERAARRLRNLWRRALDRFRLRLSRAEALPQLGVLNRSDIERSYRIG